MFRNRSNGSLRSGEIESLNRKSNARLARG
jgi:hypothetical protein